MRKFWDIPQHIKDNSQTKVYAIHFIMYLYGDGLDIGFGGRAILPSAICIDLEGMSVHHWDDPQHLCGDAANLKWFKDETMDYIYSSHCLEDFVDTKEVLKEWIRVLKPGGVIALLLPHQKRFLAAAKSLGSKGNNAHKHIEFSREFVLAFLEELGIEVIWSRNFWNENNSSDLGYNFGIVAKKTKTIMRRSRHDKYKH